MYFSSDQPFCEKQSIKLLRVGSSVTCMVVDKRYMMQNFYQRYFNKHAEYNQNTERINHINHAKSKQEPTED